MKTILTDCGLVDILVVGRALPQDEKDQIEAFTGDEFNEEQAAIGLFNGNGPMWCIRVEETGEPLVTFGLLQVGTKVWRTWFLANQRAWDEFGKEVTVHTAKLLKRVIGGATNMRIETLSLATRNKAHEWYEAIGLKYESTLTGYGVNGESAVMYISTAGARNF